MRSRTLAAIGLVLAVVLLALLAIGGLFYVRITAVTEDLDAASQAAEDYVGALSADPAAAPGHLKQALTKLEDAQQGLDSWQLATLNQAPRIGQNVSAVRTVTDEMHSLLSDAGPVLADAATIIDFDTQQLRKPAEGSSWLDSLDTSLQVIKKAPAAITAFETAQQKVHSIDTAGLLPPVRDSIEELDATLTQAAEDFAPVMTTLTKLNDSTLASALLAGAGSLSDALKDLDLGSLVDSGLDDLIDIRTPVAPRG